jgi:outer membrane protein assembly complex protein YaeT
MGLKPSIAARAGAVAQSVLPALLALLLGVATGHATTGPPIAKLRVEADGPVDAPAVAKVLGLEEGRPVDRQQIREAILAIYAGGEVEWIRIESSEVEGGIEVLVRMSFRSRISKVDVRTRNPIRRNQLRKWLDLQLGDPVSVATVEAGQRRAQRKLRERGFEDARVELYLDFRRSTNTVAVTVDLDLGQALQLDGIVLIGVDDPEVVAATLPKAKDGARLGSRLEERVRRQVEASLRTQGFWEARVVGLERQVEGHRARLEVHTEPGPRYELELVAPAELEKVVRAALPDPAKEDLHPAQTEALAERIRETLQERGFLLASVTAELDSEAPSPLMRITAEPGIIRRVNAIEFPGAMSIDEKELRNAIHARTGKTTGWRGRPVSSTTLAGDQRRIEELYRSFGFVDAAVDSPTIEADGDDGARVVFSIDEGQRWILTDLQIHGLPVEAAAVLDQRKLGLREAAPWNPGAVETTRRQLELILADAGYPEGRVSSEVSTPEPGRAEVVLKVEAGDLVQIGEVVIAGLTRTRRSVVQRTIRRAGIVPGEPFARDRMLEAQRRLYELGLFRRVELLPLPGQERRPVRGLVVHCDEGAQRSYLLGFGWNETDRFRITLGWSHLNLFGGAHAVSVGTRLSSREQRFQVGLREPRIWKLGAPGYLVVYRTTEEFATYSQRRRGTWFDIGDRRKVPFRPWFRYEYQIVAPNAPDDILSDLERENQEARISSITPTLEWDYRDDPLVPTRGTFTELSVEWAFPIFAADAEFLKLRSRFTVYGRHSHGTWSAGVRFGAIRPIGATDDMPGNLQVPLNTRFFAGGANSHRGFDTDFLGIPGQTIDEDGNPTGGNALLLANVEYVRPVTSLLSGVVFIDAGNVWAEPDMMDAGEIRWAAGLGVRLNTPAGPLRAEYGWKLDREPGESSGEFFLSFGTPF